MRIIQRAVIFVTAALIAPAASAADLAAKRLAEAVAVQPTLLPAVAGLNGSLDVAGGLMNGNGSLGAGGYGHVGGSLSIPVAQQFGVQIDGLAAATDDLRMIGTGGHAFWRDPAQMLVGVYGEGLGADVGADTLKKARLGIEGELYFNRATLSGIAGYEWGNLDIRRGLFIETLAGFYATDDLKLSAGYGYGFAGHMATARVDWQMPTALIGGATSLYGESRVGEGGYKAVLAGVKLQFGVTQKSLQRHEREDDPQMWIKSQPHAIASAKAQGQFDKTSALSCFDREQAYWTAYHAGDDDLAGALYDAARAAGCEIRG